MRRYPVSSEVCAHEEGREEGQVKIYPEPRTGYRALPAKEAGPIRKGDLVFAASGRDLWGVALPEEVGQRVPDGEFVARRTPR